MSVHTLTAAVLTFRRPRELAAGLPLVAAHVERLHSSGLPVSGDVLVIDNDPAASAEPVVRALNTPGIRYCVEAEPGISAARNRALNECADRDLLVFIDDDERPTDSWLEPLVRTWLDTRATAVMGRVVSVFETAPEPWVEAGEFFRRRSMPTGTEISVAAAGNLLLDLVELRRMGVRFDPTLGLTGGEDTAFSRHLTAAGGRIVWCEESVATDHVPAERITRRWVLLRAFSHGNIASVLAIRHAPRGLARTWQRARWVGRGGIRMLGGTLRWLLGLLTRTLRHRARGMRTVSRGAGMLTGACGWVYREYARKEGT